MKHIKTFERLYTGENKDNVVSIKWTDNEKMSATGEPVARSHGIMEYHGEEYKFTCLRYYVHGADSGWHDSIHWFEQPPMGIPNLDRLERWMGGYQHGQDAKRNWDENSQSGHSDEEILD